MRMITNLPTLAECSKGVDPCLFVKFAKLKSEVAQLVGSFVELINSRFLSHSQPLIRYSRYFARFDVRNVVDDPPLK